MTAKWILRGRFRRLAGLGLVVLAGLALTWSAGFLWFANSIPAEYQDDGRPTDAIVVLTGGSDRLQTGLELLARRKARKLLVSGVYHGVEVTELLDLSRQQPSELECCVVLGYAADDTIGNAAETASWMAEEGFQSLRLVTANYHMARSLLEFRRAMPDITVVPHPVFPEQFKREEWWRWPGTASLIATEYSKFLLAYLRHKLSLD